MLGDTDKITYLQKTLGLALTTDTSQEKCWIWYGATTRNGKSVLAETILYMLGGADGYSLSMMPETLAQRKIKDTRQASGDIARLAGCRFLNASEPPKRMLFDAALLKTMLGRDTITARHLYEREFQFVPSFKLFINTNHLPLIQDDTLFSSDRIEVITFDRHFEPHEQDHRLKDKLRTRESISGVFNWCLDGLKLYRETGLTAPGSVKAATLDYRRNSDKIQNFIDECLFETGGNAGAGAVYQRFADWCEENGYGTESKRSFFDELKSKGIFGDRGMVNGVQMRNIVKGYELSTDDRIPF
jgi:putative DNA primase/helicase